MLTEEEIQRFIEDDNATNKKKFARIGQRYYEADHDILKSRLFYYNADGKLVEDTTRSNIKICHPFFTELSDQLSSYMLSFKDNPIRAKGTAEGLQEYLDDYFDDDFWAEIEELVGGAYNKGFEYIFAYVNEEGKLSFQCADSLGVVEVRQKIQMINANILSIGTLIVSKKERKRSRESKYGATRKHGTMCRLTMKR